jgi:hypothetical protein
VPSLDLDRHQRRALNQALGSAFPAVSQLRRVLDYKVDRRLDDIVLGDDYQDIRFEVVQAAEAQGWTAELVIGAREENPGNATLLAVAEDLGLSASTPAVQRAVRAGSPYLNITPLRTALGEAEMRVCRIEIPVPGGKTYGTGFLVGPDLVMTNHHVMEPVIDKPDLAAGAIFLFDYKVLSEKVLNPGTPFSLASDGWLVADSPLSPIDEEADPKSGTPSDKELDFSVVRLAAKPGSEPVGNGDDNSPDRGWIEIKAPDKAPAPGTPLFVVQHPSWMPLKVVFEMDGVMEHDGPESRIRHRVNTEQGSSGSPCFDGDGQLVGLHHVGDPDFDRPAQFNEAIAVATIAKELGGPLA